MNYPPPSNKSQDNKDNLFDKEIAQKVVLYAKKLAAPFPFVRSDFYVVDKRVYFAELTFTPAANILSSYNEEFTTRLGQKLVLPDIVECKS